MALEESEGVGFFAYVADEETMDDDPLKVRERVRAKYLAVDDEGLEGLALGRDGDEILPCDEKSHCVTRPERCDDRGNGVLLSLGESGEMGDVYDERRGGGSFGREGNRLSCGLGLVGVIGAGEDPGGSKALLETPRSDGWGTVELTLANADRGKGFADRRGILEIRVEKCGINGLVMDSSCLPLRSCSRVANEEQFELEPTGFRDTRYSDGV